MARPACTARENAIGGAHLVGDQLGQRLGALREQLDQARHDGGALGRRHTRPRAVVEGGPCRGDRPVDVGGGSRAGETPIGSSVPGEIVSKVSVLAGATHSPPMNRRSRLMPSP